MITLGLPIDLRAIRDELRLHSLGQRDLRTKLLPTMAIPRMHQLPGRPVWIHVISRCVRKAYLCGGRDGKWDHRRQWVEDRLKELSGVFAVEVAAYAVMSNHVHAVVRMLPEGASAWSAREVVERWLSVFGKNADRMAVNGHRDPIIEHLAQDAAWVTERRARLADLSWFMRAFKEPIARRANAEEDCSGRFWEGRYVSVPLLDHAAVVACMAYVDLNPVRARMAPTPEASHFTSVKARVRARQRHRAVTRVRAQVAAGETTAEQAATTLKRAGIAEESVAAAANSAEAGSFVAPITRCQRTHDGQILSSFELSVDDYLTLVDLTGRVLRPDKRGAIDPRLPALLTRLDLKLDAWIATMTGWRQMHGRALGQRAVRDEMAEQHGLRWIKNRCPLFVQRAAS